MTTLIGRRHLRLVQTSSEWPSDEIQGRVKALASEGAQSAARIPCCRTCWRPRAGASAVVHGRRLAVEDEFDVGITPGPGGAESGRALDEHRARRGELDFLQVRGDDLDVGVIGRA